MHTYLIYACGLWGLAGSFSWSFVTSRRAMLAVLHATQPGFFFYWALQGHWTAAGMSIIAIILNIISTFMDTTEDRARQMRICFLLALVPLVALTVLSWHGYSSVLAASGMALGCLARWQIDPRRFRILMSATNLPWLAHDLLAAAAAALCADVFGLVRGLWIMARERALSAASAAITAEPVTAALTASPRSAA